MKKIIGLLVMALSLLVQSAIAEPSNQFIVSGVLRANGEGLVIKLVQGIERASSANEAVGAFTRKALNQYPGYSLIDAIASPAPIQVQPCRNSAAI